MQQIRLIVVVCGVLALATPNAKCDEAHTRYFEQLRQRGLFSLAESEAISRLATEDMPLAARTGFCVELSRTLAEHAGFVTDEQRNELWQRARSTVQEFLERDKSNPRSILLMGQLASVYVAEGDWLRAERELRPFDEALSNQARIACTKAIEQLKLSEKVLNEPSRDPILKKSANGAPLGHELRSLLHQVRWQIGLSYRNRAELSPMGSDERLKDLAEADQSLRRLVGAADEPIQSRARLLLVTCLRLKNDRERAADALTALEKSDPKPIDVVQDEMTAERVRLLMEAKRPTEAAELLLKTRGGRKRLTGELWLLQTRALIALRAITLEKQQETLADRLAEQISATIDRCEEQVGGFWGRRCRQMWDNAQTAQKYGVELDALMQQARNHFTSGRVDAALADYATAENVATEKGQSELAMELGFTKASILLDEMQFEAAAAEFLRLAKTFTTQSRAAKAHLLGTYCLGRLYDEKKTQLRREVYTDALDRHLRDYSSDATINDARFLKGQFEEQRLQASLALPIYLQIEAGHPRALDAMSGAARCFETILQRMIERHLPSEELEREAIDRLSSFLQVTEESDTKWTVTHADIALRLAGILIQNCGEQSSTSGAVTSRNGLSEKSSESSQSSRVRQAERWLARVTAFIDKKDGDADAVETIERLRPRLAPLKVVAFAANGNLIEAEKLLNSLSASPSEMLILVDRLTQFVATARGGQRTQIAKLQLSAAERLIPLRDQLSPADRDRLDRALASACVSAGQVPKAVVIAQKLAEHSTKDIDKQREFATTFGEVDHPDSQALAKQCWRRVESLTKAGSVEWLTARFGVIKACIRLNQFDEGRKLAQVTKLLYLERATEPLKSQFEALEKELQAGKVKAK